MLNFIIKIFKLTVDDRFKIGNNPKVKISLLSYDGETSSNYCKIRFRFKKEIWTPFILRWDRD